LEDGAWRVGIHIAAPALAVKPNTALDSIVQQRLSTVYMPGNKITMLPNQLVSHFSLDEGTWRPALSLYLDIDAEFQITAQSTKLEQVMIADNLRHDAIEPYFNEQNCMQDSGHAY
ncbi:MAG: RNB domain-containing ribonuclease, partial [Methylophilaceae bacterium]